MTEFIGSVLVLIQDFKPTYLLELAEGSWRLEGLTEPVFGEASLVDHVQQHVTNVAAQTTTLATVKHKP